MKEAKLFKKEKDNVRCLACAHKCLIKKDNVGICGVRKNVDGKLFLLVYGRVVSMNIDPIEKKPLYNFLPGSFAFSIGTVGCNLACSWCQNYDISQVSKQGMILGEKMSIRDIINEAVKTGCKSIAYTYNEPVIWVEFVKDIAELAKEKGLKNVMVTNGYWSKESFDFINEHIDAVNIDLKSLNEKTYKKYCGCKLQPVLDTIKRVHDAGIHIEITTLLIPGLNDSDKELTDIARFIADIDENIPWHISRFFPMYKMRGKEITSISSLKRAEKIGKKYLKHVYLGNI